MLAVTLAGAVITVRLTNSWAPGSYGAMKARRHSPGCLPIGLRGVRIRCGELPLKLSANMALTPAPRIGRRDKVLTSAASCLSQLYLPRSSATRQERPLEVCRRPSDGAACEMFVVETLSLTFSVIVCSLDMRDWFYRRRNCYAYACLL